jgi:hypothetical protein
MRGWLTVLTKESAVSRYRTGIFVASSEPDVAKRAFDHVQSNFSQLSLAFLAPSAYSELLAGRAQPFWTEDLRAHPIQSLRALRKLNFDLAFVLLAGRPTFHKAKLAAFLLNTRRVVIYTEDGNSIVVDRAHWNALIRLLRNQCRFCRVGSILFIPFGFLYLLGRTFWLCKRHKEVNWQARDSEASTIRPIT